MSLEKIKYFATGTRLRAIITGGLIFLMVSAADYNLRNDISLDVFYFLPIIILTWRVGKNWGTAAALASVFVWLTDERVFAPDIGETYNIVLWNALVRLAFFYIVVVLMDEMRRLVEKERSVSNLKSAMIHTVSHEFNNALTGLSAGLFLLKETDQSASDETRDKIYASMDGSQRKLSLYVKNILNEARMEEGRFRMQKHPVALRDLVSAAADSLQELLHQKNIKLSMLMPEVPVLVNADSEALALVISNLLGNAVKYTRQGGEIEVRLEPAGTPPEKVVLSVEDSGIGISLAASTGARKAGPRPTVSASA
jgi:signal transduction histidine kinase